METIVKLFPVENVYSSIEVHLKDNEAIDRVAIAKHIAILDEFKYVAPKWPVGITCPVCGKGMVAYRKFQSKPKPGQPQGAWYAMYSCSVKDCSFTAWCDVNDDTKTPKDEPFRSAFLNKNKGVQQQPAKPAATQPAPVSQPASNGRGSALNQQADDHPDFLDDDLPF